MKPSSYNLFMAALYGGRKGPRPPVGNPTSIVCHGLMDAVGVSFPEAHLNAQAMAELALAGHELLGFDTVMPEYSVDQEAGHKAEAPHDDGHDESRDQDFAAI